MSHHLFQESKNCKLGFFFFNNAKYQRTPGQDLFPTLCPTLNKTMSQFSGFKQPGPASDVQALSVFFFFVSTHSSFLYSEFTNGSSLPRGFLFCHFFLGNVIKELGMGCFTHTYSDSLLAINGCRFYYLSGFEFYYLL